MFASPAAVASAAVASPPATPPAAAAAPGGPADRGRSPARRPERKEPSPRPWGIVLLVAVVPPLVVFCGFRLMYSSSTDSELTSMRPEVWARWDSGNYEDITTRGYYWDDCVDHDRLDLDGNCTNAAWYPLYPGLMNTAMRLTGTDRATAGVYIAQASALALLLVVWNGLLRRRTDVCGYALLVLAGFFPGGVYYFAEFPISLLCLLLVLQVVMFRKRRWWVGAAAGAAAGLTYPVAIVLVPVSLLWLVLCDRDGRWYRRVLRLVGVGVMVASGTFIVFAIHARQLGRWDASLVAQQRFFDGGLHNPAANLLAVTHSQSTWVQVNRPELSTLLALQSLLVLALVVAAAIAVLRRRSHRTPDDLALLTLVVALWLLPLTGNVDTGLYRREAALLPVVGLLGRLPRAVVVGFAVAAVGLAWLMAAKYYWYVLV